MQCIAPKSKSYQKAKTPCVVCPFRHNIAITTSPSIKPVVWIASTRSDLASFPEEVKDIIGYALYVAQCGGKHSDAKPLHGFGGAGIFEIVEDHAGDTIAPCIRSDLRDASMSYMRFRKNPRAEVRLQNPRLSSSKCSEEEHSRWLEAQKGRGRS